RLGCRGRVPEAGQQVADALPRAELHQRVQYRLPGAGEVLPVEVVFGALRVALVELDRRRVQAEDAEQQRVRVAGGAEERYVRGHRGPVLPGDGQQRVQPAPVRRGRAGDG